MVLLNMVKDICVTASNVVTSGKKYKLIRQADLDLLTLQIDQAIL